MHCEIYVVVFCPGMELLGTYSGGGNVNSKFRSSVREVGWENFIIFAGTQFEFSMSMLELCLSCSDWKSRTSV